MLRSKGCPLPSVCSQSRCDSGSCRSLGLPRMRACDALRWPADSGLAAVAACACG